MLSRSFSPRSRTFDSPYSAFSLPTRALSLLLPITLSRIRSSLTSSHSLPLFQCHSWLVSCTNAFFYLREVVSDSYRLKPHGDHPLYESVGPREHHGYCILLIPHAQTHVSCTDSISRSLINLNTNAFVSAIKCGGNFWPAIHILLKNIRMESQSASNYLLILPISFSVSRAVHVKTSSTVLDSFLCLFGTAHYMYLQVDVLCCRPCTVLDAPLHFPTCIAYVPPSLLTITS